MVMNKIKVKGTIYFQKLQEIKTYMIIRTLRRYLFHNLFIYGNMRLQKISPHLLRGNMIIIIAYILFLGKCPLFIFT